MFPISYFKEFQPVKYYFSRISNSRNVKLDILHYCITDFSSIIISNLSNILFSEKLFLYFSMYFIQIIIIQNYYCIIILVDYACMLLANETYKICLRSMKSSYQSNYNKIASHLKNVDKRLYIFIFVLLAFV